MTISAHLILWIVILILVHILIRVLILRLRLASRYYFFFSDCDFWLEAEGTALVSDLNVEAFGRHLGYQDTYFIRKGSFSSHEG